MVNASRGKQAGCARKPDDPAVHAG